MEIGIFLTAKKERWLCVLLLLSCIMLNSCGKAGDPAPDPKAPALTGADQFSKNGGLYVVTLKQTIIVGSTGIITYETHVPAADGVAGDIVDGCLSNLIFSFSTYPNKNYAMTDDHCSPLLGTHLKGTWSVSGTTLTLTDDSKNGAVILSGTIDVTTSPQGIMTMIFTTTNLPSGNNLMYTMVNAVRQG